MSIPAPLPHPFPQPDTLFSHDHALSPADFLSQGPTPTSHEVSEKETTKLAALERDFARAKAFEKLSGGALPVDATFDKSELALSQPAERTQSPPYEKFNKSGKRYVLLDNVESVNANYEKLQKSSAPTLISPPPSYNTSNKANLAQPEAVAQLPAERAHVRHSTGGSTSSAQTSHEGRRTFQQNRHRSIPVFPIVPVYASSKDEYDEEVDHHLANSNAILDASPTFDMSSERQNRYSNRLSWGSELSSHPSSPRNNATSPNRLSFHSTIPPASATSSPLSSPTRSTYEPTHTYTENEPDDQQTFDDAEIAEDLADQLSDLHSQQSPSTTLEGTDPRDYYWEYLTLKREYEFMVNQYITLRKQNFTTPPTSQKRNTEKTVEEASGNADGSGKESDIKTIDGYCKSCSKKLGSEDDTLDLATTSKSAKVGASTNSSPFKDDLFDELDEHRSLDGWRWLFWLGGGLKFWGNGFLEVSVIDF